MNKIDSGFHYTCEEIIKILNTFYKLKICDKNYLYVKPSKTSQIIDYLYKLK